jgi:ABC-2 type transport system ATP-binding protein
MNSEVVIRVDNVKKSFKVYYDRSKTLKDILSLPGKTKHENREVLKGISFEVKKGEAVALIGKNGCGKSTTLKLLTRIIYPDSGEIKVNGKVSSLLELGAGFHPDMSGRENIYLNASVFGLTKKEIDKKVEEIIRFSELEEFIDNPVRTYSSGMYMRLAFSVAINVQAEILLIDEILGVGDVSFQKKCFSKLQEIKSNGATIVIVSHSMNQIEEICDRSIWIEDGHIVEEGDTKTVDAHYYTKMEEERLRQLERDHPKEEQQDQSDVQEEVEQCSNVENIQIRGICICNQNDQETQLFQTGDNLKVTMEIETLQEPSSVNVCIRICKNQVNICGICRVLEKGEVDVHKRTVTAVFENLQLQSGSYEIQAGVYPSDAEIMNEIQCTSEFMMSSAYDGKESGICHIEHFWN